MIKEKSKHSLHKGFAERLTALIDYAQIHRHGRLTWLAKETGLTPGGARLMFSDDRPPKRQEVLDKLFSGLSARLSEIHDEPISAADIENFLLYNDKNPIPEHNFDELEKLIDSVSSAYVGKIFVEIDSIAKSLDIDIYNDFPLDKTDQLTKKILQHCIKEKQEVEGEEFKDLTSSIIKLAKAGLL